MYRAILVFIFGMAVITGVLSLVNQRALWHRTTAWSYRRPESVEPSDAAMNLRRVVMFVASLVLAGLGVWLCAAGDPAGYGAADVRSAAVKGARQLERSHPASTAVFEFNVQDAMNDVTRYGALTVTTRGTDTAGNGRFEITNKNGKHPVCLTVSGAEPTGAGIRATVASGPC